MTKAKMRALMARVRAGKVTARDRTQLRKNAAKARKARARK